MKVGAGSLTLILLLCSVPIHSLKVQTANQQYSLTSHYSTLGPNQLRQYVFNFTLVYANKDTDTCTFKNTNTTHKKGSLLVIHGSLPNTPACTSDVYSKHTAMARLAQASGFAGVVTQSEEKFYSGRIVGFDSSITIPYIIVSKSTISFIASNVSLILEIELPKISDEDANDLKVIRVVYFIWRILGGSLYGSQVFIIGYALWVERFFLRKTRKVLWQSVSLKILAFIAALCSFLWVSVDPFGFSGSLFPSAMFVGVVVGCFFCIFMFLLQIWTLASGSLGFMNWRVVSIIIYVLSVLMVAITLFQGMLWYNKPLRYATFSVMFMILALCGVGFFLTGRRMIAVIRNSSNMSEDQSKLARKITNFVIFFLLLNSTALIIYLSACLGKVVSLMVVHIVCGIIILCTFIILFLPVVLKQQPLLAVDSNQSLENCHSLKTPQATKV